ncbi:MAG: hypothetical protein AAF985_25680, partial [Bacteroidota bacterium]
QSINFGQLRSKIRQMKKLIMLCLILGSTAIEAQEQGEEVLRNVFNDLYGGHLSDGTTPFYAFNQNEQEAKLVGGSQFLSEDWESGLVLMPDNKAYGVEGRYDIHNDEMQILVEGKVKVLQPHQIKAISLGNQIFVYRSFTEGEAAQKGYFEILVEGKVSLFLRRTTKTKRANPHPVLGSVNDDFKVVTKESLYYRKRDKPLRYLKRKKKAVLTALSRKKKAITQLAKEERLNVKKTEDLIRLFSFYNEK